MLRFDGHAIVSTDGMIADGEGDFPQRLRNAADWRHYQAALDACRLVVTGRRGHQRHPNPGRRRLVLTRSVADLAPDPDDPLATFWNPGGMSFAQALAALGVGDGVVAITGLFDLFLPHYTRFVLSEHHDLVIGGGTPCFSAGHPRAVLAAAGMVPSRPDIIDPEAMVTTTLWSRDPSAV